MCLTRLRVWSNIWRIEMANPKLITPRDAAQILGVSYPTLKQWIYKGKLKTVKTAGGHHRIPESELDRYLSRITEKGPVPERRSGFPAHQREKSAGGARGGN